MVVHQLLDEAGSVTTTDDSGGAAFFANELGGDGAGGGVSGVFGIAQESIPDDSVSIGDEIG